MSMAQNDRGCREADFLRTFRTGDFVFKKKKAAQKQICSAAAFLQTGQGKEDLKRNLVFVQLPKSDQRFIFQNSQ